MALSPGEAAFLQSDPDGIRFPHRLTRTPAVSGPEDPEGNAIPLDGTPTTGLHCRFRADDTLRTDTGGRTTIYRPNISLPHDSPLAVGDLVSAVTNSAGVVLLAGPLVCESVVPIAAFGPTTSLRAYLRGGTVRR